ncbi:hypothetical protein [Alloprevotella tannerae]|uniref:hypothetical protein n=2 Tax=Alloprevotella tannerae TaxID=76122 RepID=UPI00288C3C30|nr:hypothetical protein [Alloprevotella tannerae]
MGLYHTQVEFAEKMKSSKTNVSSALKGDERVLTDRFLKRFYNAFIENLSQYSLDWLLTGQGEMLVRDESEINVFGNGNALGAAASVTNNTTYGSCNAENSRADATLNKVLDMLQAAQDRIGDIQKQLTDHNATSVRLLDLLQEKDALILRLTNKLLDK